MLNQINAKSKCFKHQLNHQTTTSNTKPPYPEDESSYLVPIYSTDSALIDRHIQLVTYFV